MAKNIKSAIIFLLAGLMIFKHKTGTNTMIDYNEDRKDLQIDRLHENLVEELEEQAAALGVTVDYYISEFTNLSVKQ
jgi:hypothetical protein